MTVQQAVREAREFNQCAVIAARMGDVPATLAAMRQRRDYYMSVARKGAK